MKLYRKVAIVFGYIVLLNFANKCFATEETINYTKNGLEFIDHVYYIETEKKEEFLNEIKKEININGNKYTHVNTQIEKQDVTDTINIENSKTEIMATNNRSEIIEFLGRTKEYTENGYVGTYVLDENSISIKTINNGYYEKIFDKKVEYTDLDKNDLYLIPKQIECNGRILVLLKTDWYITSKTNIGNVQVPSKYKANCYYATKERIYRPNTYLVTANYIGTAEKTIEKPIKIILTYKKILEEKEEITEEKENNFIFYTGSTTIVVFLGALLLLENKVKVYNYKNGKWSYIGKARITNKKINLSKFQNKEVSNQYRIELSKVQVKKYSEKKLTIYKAKNKVDFYVRNIDGTCDFEIRI